MANAIILPMTGWLANHFGRKRLLMCSVVGFTAASFLCGLAPTLPLLIVFRVIQGAPAARCSRSRRPSCSKPSRRKDRGKAMGFWGLGIVVAPILGPVLGGWLTDSYSWRWVFYINMPVGIASILMTQLFIFDPPYIGATNGAASTTGASACWPWGSARCRSCSTRGRRRTGSLVTSSCRCW